MIGGAAGNLLASGVLALLGARASAMRRSSRGDGASRSSRRAH